MIHPGNWVFLLCCSHLCGHHHLCHHVLLLQVRRPHRSRWRPITFQPWRLFSGREQRPHHWKWDTIGRPETSAHLFPSGLCHGIGRRTDLGQERSGVIGWRDSFRERVLAIIIILYYSNYSTVHGFYFCRVICVSLIRLFLCTTSNYLPYVMNINNTGTILWC